MERWVVESARAGVTREVFNDGMGTLGVPGTWYRVSGGANRVPLVTRNRGDALRDFQRRVMLR